MKSLEGDLRRVMQPNTAENLRVGTATKLWALSWCSAQACVDHCGRQGWYENALRSRKCLCCPSVMQVMAAVHSS